MGMCVRNCIKVEIPSMTELVPFYFLQGKTTPSLKTVGGTLRFYAQMQDYHSAIVRPLLSKSFLHCSMKITLHFKKLREQRSVSLSNVLKLISLVQKENPATLATKQNEKRNMPDTKKTWSKSGDTFPAAHLPSPLLAASA